MYKLIGIAIAYLNYRLGRDDFSSLYQQSVQKYCKHFADAYSAIDINTYVIVDIIYKSLISKYGKELINSPHVSSKSTDICLVIAATILSDYIRLDKEGATYKDQILGMDDLDVFDNISRVRYYRALWIIDKYDFKVTTNSCLRIRGWLLNFKVFLSKYER